MKRFFVIASLFVSTQVWAAFGYYSPVTINAAQVPSTQTDFPVLVSVTDARFKSVANGGHCQTNFDIRPYTDSSLSTAITGYELERYNASTGEVVIWVKVSSLSSSTTPFVLAYGNASLTTDGSSTTTWPTPYIGVYHLADGTTLNVNSATGINNGTNHSVTATTGQIDGAGGFVSVSSQYIDIGSPTLASFITISAWIKATSFPGAYNAVVVSKDAGNTLYAQIFVKSTGKLAMFVSTSNGDISYDGTGSTTLSTGTWYYVTFRYLFDTTGNGGGLYGYVNGSQDKYVACNSCSISNAANPTYIGNDTLTAGRFWNGAIDQVSMVASTSAAGTRSANWITTEYNNQSAPSTFETLGTEVNLSAEYSFGG